MFTFCLQTPLSVCGIFEEWKGQRARRKEVTMEVEFQACWATMFRTDRFDLVWNADYTTFVPVRLAWWDDRSYIAYQTAGMED